MQKRDKQKTELPVFEHEHVVSFYESSFRRIMLALFIGLFSGFLFGTIGYLVGLIHQMDIQTAKEQLEVEQNPQDTGQKTLTYQYVIPDVAIPVFQMDLPANWSAYSESDSPITINFGKSHFMSGQYLSDIPAEIIIHVTQDHTLASKDPRTWTHDDQLALFGATPLANGFTQTTVNGLTAKKTFVLGLGGNVEVVYLVNGDELFTFINRNADSQTFNHMLSTFKILNNHLPIKYK